MLCRVLSRLRWRSLAKVLQGAVQTAVAKSGKGAVQGALQGVVQSAVAKSGKGAVQGALQNAVQGAVQGVV